MTSQNDYFHDYINTLWRHPHSVCASDVITRAGLHVFVCHVIKVIKWLEWRPIKCQLTVANIFGDLWSENTKHTKMCAKHVSHQQTTQTAGKPSQPWHRELLKRMFDSVAFELYHPSNLCGKIRIVKRPTTNNCSAQTVYSRYGMYRKCWRTLGKRRQSRIHCAPLLDGLLGVWHFCNCKNHCLMEGATDAESKEEATVPTRSDSSEKRFK